MGLFPEAQAAQLAGRDPRCSWLILLDFATAPERIWLDYGEIEAGGHVWRGIGQMGSISGLEQVVNGEAPEMTITLSGLERARGSDAGSLLSLARDEFEAEARDRDVIVYLQFLDAVDDIALDAPYPITRAKMQRPQFVINEDGSRSVSVACEALYALRSRPPYAMYTDADQQRRFAGDKGFSFVSTLRNKKTVWPDF